MRTINLLHVRVIPAKVDFQNENFKKIFLSKTTMPRALILDM